MVTKDREMINATSPFVRYCIIALSDEIFDQKVIFV